MKYNISLSLKTTMLAALPCLALSLFAVSCSDDDSAVVPEKTTKGKTISFTVAAPQITDITTRIGLDENNLPSSGNDSEPVIWLENDVLAFNFVKHGATTGLVVPYTISNYTPGQSSYELTTDQEIDLEDGLYEVYVVGPGTENSTFKGGAVSGTTIDMRGQDQPEVTDYYRNLTNYYYQHAYTLVKIVDNEVVEGSQNIQFKGLTSMIRYRITNNFSNAIKVVKINISNNDEESGQFYTRGTFDPSSVDKSIQPAGTPVSTLGLKTSQGLNPTEQFNAYMSLIPTAGVDPSTPFTVSVYFTINNILYKKVWNVTASVLHNGNYPAGGRWLQNLNLTGDYENARLEELDDLEEDDLTPPVVPAESVTITSNSTTNEITVNETLELSATINPYGAIGTIVWSSSDEEVATVDENGVVTGVAAGEATITATVQGTEIKSTLSVTVGVAGVGSETINDLTYKTYTYTPPMGTTVTWMMNNYNSSAPMFGYTNATMTCPLGWYPPSLTDLENLRVHMTTFPEIATLFIDNTEGPDYIVTNSASGQSTQYVYQRDLRIVSENKYNGGGSGYTAMVVTGLRVKEIPFACDVVPLNSSYFFTNPHSQQHFYYPARCVKPN